MKMLTQHPPGRQPELHGSLCPHYDRCSAAYCPAAGGTHLKGEPVCALLREAVKNGPGAVLSDRIPSPLAARVLQVAGRLGPNGQALVHNAKSAFMSGQREALLIGAVTLFIGVAFLILRGGTPVAETDTDWDEAFDLQLEPVAG